MKKFICSLLLIIALPKIESLYAADFPRAYKDNKIIVLENEFLRFEIDPLDGGRVSSFIDKRDGDERVVPGRIPGLCFDQFYDQDFTPLNSSFFKKPIPYGAEIIESNLPSKSILAGVEPFTCKTPLELILYGGEDYELLFTAKAEFLDVKKDIEEKFKVPITEIGSVLPRKSGCMLTTSEGSRIPLKPEGWDHFK